MSQGEIDALRADYEQVVLSAMECNVSVNTSRERQQALYEATLELSETGVDVFAWYDAVWEREVGRSDLTWPKPK